MRRFQSPARRYKQALVIAIMLVASAFVALSQSPDRPRLASCDSPSKGISEVWETIARARLSHLQSRFKHESAYFEMGLKMGDPAWDGYVNELQGVYQQFFKPDKAESRSLGRLKKERNDSANVTSLVERVQQKLDESFNALSEHIGHPEYERLSDFIPHKIHTTFKKPWFPSEFSSWDRMNAPDGWEMEFWDDDRIWRWMKEVFGRNGSTVDDNVEEAEGAQILKVYQQIPQGVLRADLFRYLVLLMEGGLYTDTDTACVRPIRQWPGIRENHWDLMWKTDPLLVSLPQMYDLHSVATCHGARATRGNLSSGQGHNAVESWINDYERNSWEPPKLIVAVEFDYWGPNAEKTWTEIGYSRGFQIVQWTMLAQPGHPVFLDVLGRIIQDVAKDRSVSADYTKGQFKEEISKETLFNVLDFTGPGVFSDAVFRYLLARWGTHPRDISGASGPVRIGDVLIYPLKSFSAVGDIDNYQGEHTLVWHGRVDISRVHADFG